MKNNLKKKLTIAEYNVLREKTLLSLPAFLKYSMINYPNNEKGDYFDFYLKERALKMGSILSLHCELTPFCNLDCKMCYVHLEQSTQCNDTVLSTEQWLEIFKQAVENDVYEVCLSGGEAMLHPGFWDIYNFLFSKGIQITVFTNGIALTDKAVQRFKAKPPKYIQISIYGTNDDVYENVTGQRVFSQVEKALERLIEFEIPFKIAITPNRYLFEDMENIIRYVNDRNYSYRINKSLSPPREETGRVLEDVALSNEEYLIVWKIYQSISGSSPFKDKDENHLISKDEIKKTMSIPCSAGMTSGHINYKGQMNACVLLQVSNDEILENDFNTAWNRIHDKCMKYNMPVECKKCEYLSVCSYCPAEHILDKYEAKCNLDVCKRTKEYIKNGLIKLT